MNENDFWKIIELVDQQALEEHREHDAAQGVLCELESRAADAIMGFYSHLTDALYSLDTKSHFDAGPSPLGDDSFLGFRCYIVGKGRRFYEIVRDDPSKTPKRFASFETLLITATTAWSMVTGRKGFDYNYAGKSFETCSNSQGWFVPGALHSIEIVDTRQSIEAMLAANKREPATLGPRYELSDFVSCLNKSDFRSSYSNLEMTLNPRIEHGHVKLTHAPGKQVRLGETARSDVGFNAEKFIAMGPKERSEFFVEAASAALLCLHEDHGEAAGKIAMAKSLMS